MHGSQGNQKLALVPKPLLVKYEPVFNEHELYEIETSNVIKSDDNYREVDDDLSIFIRSDTIVTKVNYVDAVIPRYKFSIVNEDILALRVGKTELLTEVSPMSLLSLHREGYTHFRGHGKMIVATLWSDKTKLIDESVVDISDQPVTVIITSTVIKFYKGEFSFNSTNATNATKGARYSFAATIMSVNTSGRWFYVSCPNCKKSMKDEKLAITSVQNAART